MNYTFSTTIKQEEHDAFIVTSEYCNLLQSASWAKVKHNWKSAIVGVYQNNTLVASALVLIKPLPLKLAMLYLPRGPILDYNNQELVNFFLLNLKKWAKKQHCLFIKMDPAIKKNKYTTNTISDGILEETKICLNNLKVAGAIHKGYPTDMKTTIQPRLHAVVEKTDSFIENLPKHTKRHINIARKKEVSVNIYGIDKINEFSHLIKLTEDRKSIQLRDVDCFSKLMEAYPKQSKLFLAHINLPQLLQKSIIHLEEVEQNIKKCTPEQFNKLKDLLRCKESLQQDIDSITKYRQVDGEEPFIAGALCVFFGTTCEMLYMAMDGKYKRFMAPYLTHIAPMEYSFNHGYKYCNMGGLEGTLDGGLTKFKGNFNPMIYDYVGEFDIPVNKIVYKASQIVYKIKKHRLYVKR